MAEELRVSYHRTLEQIDQRVMRLFALVADGIGAGTHALLSSDREVARSVTEREDLIDTLYVEVEQLVNSQFALNSPVATELRFLLTVLRVVPELERSHDLAEHIARRGTMGLYDELSPRARGMVGRMGDLGVRMWRDAAEAWAVRDQACGDRLDLLDDEMDDLHTAMTAELASGRMTLPVAMDMALVARFYERLGDHAVNIARRVSYLVTGDLSS
jgi:phosphate transport system protein